MSAVTAVARKALPPGTKHALRATVRAYGTATGRWRVLPDFLIIGAMKAGTTSLYAYLLLHPDIGGPEQKEIDYFQNPELSEAWYRGHFPWRFQRARLIGEASPNYIFAPEAPPRAAALLPAARLILLVRDPVDRALSHYNHVRVAGREPLSFEDAIAAEQRGDGARTYLAYGLYAEQLERWLAHYPREQLLVLSTEELDVDTESAYRQALDHLGATPFSLPRYERKLAREYDGMSDDTRSALTDYFREPNERLFALIGRRLWGA